MNVLYWLGDFAYVLIVISYLVKDMLWLRALAILASVSMITFNFSVPATPLWPLIRWNLVMLLINVIQIGVLLRERRDIKMSEEETELYQTLFYTLSPMEFRKLLRIARWRTLEPQHTLLKQGEAVPSLMLVLGGAARVLRDGETVTTLREGAFIGEMSFITRKAASATVTAEEKTRVLEWPFPDLNPLLIKYPSIRISLQAVLGSDMAKKLEG